MEVTVGIGVRAGVNAPDRGLSTRSRASFSGSQGIIETPAPIKEAIHGMPARSR